MADTKNEGVCEAKNNCAGCKAGDKVRGDWGRAVAGAAIKEMSKSNLDDLPSVDSSEVKAFIEECDKSGADIVNVVFHIAQREGINIGSNDAPDEPDKARLWAFLVEVLKTFADKMATLASQKIAHESFDWKDFIADYISYGIINQEDKEYAKPQKSVEKIEHELPDIGLGRCFLKRGKGYASFGYAFSW